MVGNPVNARTIDLAKQRKICALLANRTPLYLDQGIKAKQINGQIKNTHIASDNLPISQRNTLRLL
jgi:hypothetical protein